jgi:hypothetical protein
MKLDPSKLAAHNRVCDALREMGRGDVAATLDEWVSEHALEDEESQRGLGRLVWERHGTSGLAALGEATPAAVEKPTYRHGSGTDE